MAVPKRRRSKSKKRMNKANWIIKVPTMYECPECNEMAISHNACTVCGYYNGKKVLTVKVKEKKKQDKENN